MRHRPTPVEDVRRQPGSGLRVRSWRRFAGRAARRARGAGSLLLASLALLAIPAGRLGGQSPDTSAVLTGTVVSALTGGPLEGAAVSVKGAPRAAYTDDRGRFSLMGLPPGRNTVDVAMIGFSKQQLPIELAPDGVTRVTLLLSRTVLEMEEISVTVRRDRVGKLREFHEREERGFGYFLTPEDVERRNARFTSDLLRGVPGVSVGAHSIYGTEVRIGRRSVNAHCRQPTVYIDGRLAMDFKIDDLESEDVLAVEIYRGAGETPPLFKFGGATCGTVVFWTRDGLSR